MNAFTLEANDRKMQHLKSLKQEEKVKQTSVRENDSLVLQDKSVELAIALEREKTFVFTPQNDLEEIAIAIAREAGWKGSLYSLDYTDTYREQTCFVFATQPKESENQQWLLVSNDSRNDAKYMATLGGMPLKDIYYAWTKLVQKPLPPQSDLITILNQQIASTLYLWHSITLKELADIFPVKRLTEIYLYLKIACDDPRHKIDLGEEIILIKGDNPATDRQITIPILTFYREVDFSVPPKPASKDSFSKMVQELQVERVKN